MFNYLFSIHFHYATITFIGTERGQLTVHYVKEGMHFYYISLIHTYIFIWVTKNVF